MRAWLAIALLSSAAHAQNMRDACASTRQRVQAAVQSGQMTCAEVRAQADQQLARYRSAESANRSHAHLDRTYGAAGDAIHAASACVQSIAANCGSSGGPSAQEQAQIRQFEQQERMVEQEIAALEAQAQAQMQMAQQLEQYVYEHMPWVLSDEERERLQQAGGHIQSVGGGFDQHSGDIDRQVEDLQRSLGLHPPPGTRIEQVGNGYVVRDASGNVLYRLAQGENGELDLVPSPGTQRDNDALVLGDQARSDLPGALDAQLSGDGADSDPRLGLRNRMLDDLAHRAADGPIMDPDSLPDVIDFPGPGEEAAPPPPAEAPSEDAQSEDAEAESEDADVESEDAETESEDAEAEGEEPLRDPPPDRGLPENEDPLPPLDFDAPGEADPAPPSDPAEVDDPQASLDPPLPEDQPLDPTVPLDPTGPTDSPNRYADEIDFDRPDTADPTQPLEPNAPLNDPDHYARTVDFGEPSSAPAQPSSPDPGADGPVAPPEVTVPAGTSATSSDAAVAPGNADEPEPVAAPRSPAPSSAPRSSAPSPSTSSVEDEPLDSDADPPSTHESLGQRLLHAGHAVREQVEAAVDAVSEARHAMHDPCTLLTQNRAECRVVLGTMQAVTGASSWNVRRTRGGLRLHGEGRDEILERLDHATQE